MPAPLTDDQRQHLRRVLVEEVMPRFGGDQSAVAEALGVDQATINRLVKRGVGGSLGLAEAVAKYLNDSPSRVLGLGAEDVIAPKLREVLGFDAAMKDALKQVGDEYRGRLDAQRLERAADHRMVPPPGRILPGLLIQLALCLPVAEPDGEGQPRRKK
jgi:hypothetical protein